MPPSPPRWPRSPALRDAFIELHGPLGAGKTTFVRHLLRALGVQRPHQEPDLRRGGALRAAGPAGDLALRLLPLQRPARVGRRGLSRRLRRARPEARRVAREGRPACCRARPAHRTSSRWTTSTRAASRCSASRARGAGAAAHDAARHGATRSLQRDARRAGAAARRARAGLRRQPSSPCASGRRPTTRA